MSDEVEECLEPCAYPGCALCRAYWERMVDEGLWVPGEGWTQEALFQAVMQAARPPP